MTCFLCSWSAAEINYPFVYETAHWRVVLAPNQSLLGRCVVQLKRHVGGLAEGTPDELLEWLEVVQKLERALKIAFGATMFNWSCYMNHAYHEKLYNPHLHWWVVPRFDAPVTLAGRMFSDPHFGSPYDHHRWEDVSSELRAEIVTRLQRALLL